MSNTENAQAYHNYSKTHVHVNFLEYLLSLAQGSWQVCFNGMSPVFDAEGIIACPANPVVAVL